MKNKRVVLVDGAANFWGNRVAARLVAHPELHVIGLDETLPEKEIKGLDFIQADIRNSLITELLRQEKVDTLCHLTFTEALRHSEAEFDLNVMGTMKLLGMCADAGVRKVVLKSSTMVYGARPTNSAYLRETQPLQGNRDYAYIRDLTEIEAFCNGFVRQSPEMALTILRFAHIVGPNADTPMTRFLRDEEAMVLLGFDPLVQVIHEEDVVNALVHAVIHDKPGIFNVSAEGVMPLWKAMGLAGKVSVPIFHTLAYLAVSLLGPRYAPIELDYLRYPCVADLTKMRTDFEFTPQYTGEEALREFASHQRIRQYLPEATARALEEERLRDTIERRKRARKRTRPGTRKPKLVKGGANHD
jgi:UDP-glucose 4-epimerase